MKVKSVWILTLASLATTSVLANPISNGKLISHKEWGIPNIKLTYKTMQPNQNKLIHFKPRVKNEKFDHLIQTYNKMESVAFSKENPSTISATGMAAVDIINNTSSEQFYMITRSVCAVSESNEEMPEQCSNVRDFIAVEAGAEYTNMSDIDMSWSNFLPGDYTISISTAVQDGRNNHVKYLSFDGKFITVPAKA